MPIRLPGPTGTGTALLLLALCAPPAIQACENHALAHHHAPAVSAGPLSPAAQRFKAENDAAMDKMMADMAVPATGDIDRDFVAMMIPHHQGAIDMAVALLRQNTGNAQLQRLAQEIIVTQQQEIAAMRLAIGEAPPASAPAPTNPPIAR